MKNKLHCVTQGKAQNFAV